MLERFRDKNINILILDLTIWNVGFLDEWKNIIFNNHENYSGFCCFKDLFCFGKCIRRNEGEGRGWRSANQKWCHQIELSDMCTQHCPLLAGSNKPTRSYGSQIHLKSWQNTWNSILFQPFNTRHHKQSPARFQELDQVSSPVLHSPVFLLLIKSNKLWCLDARWHTIMIMMLI